MVPVHNKSLAILSILDGSEVQRSQDMMSIVSMSTVSVGKLWCKVVRDSGRQSLSSVLVLQLRAAERLTR